MDSTQELIRKINILKEKKDAVILAHNYQTKEVQEIADFLGDSLDLSRRAAELKNKVLVFCGVHFMAETVAILSPSKTVLLPDMDAGCPMADMITSEKLMHIKLHKPDAAVVCYVNTSAEIKALSDICCTSSNAVDIVNSLEEKEIIFIPDRNLGSYAATRTKKKIILYDGYCPTHQHILPENITEAKTLHPEAVMLVHPECVKEVCDKADFVGSTNGMIKYAAQSDKNEFIIGTESGIIHRLEKENPGKKFYPAAPHLVCPNMKKITLEKIYLALENMQYEIKVPDHIAKLARKPIEKMLELNQIKARYLASQKL